MEAFEWPHGAIGRVRSAWSKLQLSIKGWTWTVCLFFIVTTKHTCHLMPIFQKVKDLCLLRIFQNPKNNSLVVGR